MNEIYLIIAAVLALILILGILGEALWKWLTRERGPWVVTRVGVGGREFWDFRHPRTGEDFWTMDPRKAPLFHDLELAESRADRLLADVAPLSQFTKGGV